MAQLGRNCQINNTTMYTNLQSSILKTGKTSDCSDICWMYSSHFFLVFTSLENETPIPKNLTARKYSSKSLFGSTL
jgi:hypothetical protein